MTDALSDLAAEGQAIVMMPDEDDPEVIAGRFLVDGGVMHWFDGPSWNVTSFPLHLVHQIAWADEPAVYRGLDGQRRRFTAVLTIDHERMLRELGELLDDM